MEVIKEGKDPEDKEYEATCRNCRAQVKFKKKEAKVVSDFREGDYLTVDCPTCDNKIHVAI